MILSFVLRGIYRSKPFLGGDYPWLFGAVVMVLVGGYGQIAGAQDLRPIEGLGLGQEQVRPDPVRGSEGLPAQGRSAPTQLLIEAQSLEPVQGTGGEAIAVEEGSVGELLSVPSELSERSEALDRSPSPSLLNESMNTQAAVGREVQTGLKELFVLSNKFAVPGEVGAHFSRGEGGRSLDGAMAPSLAPSMAPERASTVRPRLAQGKARDLRPEPIAASWVALGDGLKNGGRDVAQAVAPADLQAGAQDAAQDAAQAGAPDPSLANRPSYRFHGVVVQEGDDTSGRGRATMFYPLGDQVLVGGELDLSAGRGFGERGGYSLDLNELYVALAPKGVPQLRVVAGLMDLTSYFDRNSFAKDRATHFFNGVFQTNPALSAAGIASRPGLLVNWSPLDTLEVKGTVFSSNRGPSNLAFDAYAGEIGVRLGPAIVRGTYASARDSGRKSGFREIFDLQREDGGFGVAEGDRETAFGLNAEMLVPNTKLGLFGRYGRYHNQEVDAGGQTYSLGLNLLDVWGEGDRLGLAYGRQLSSDRLRRRRPDDDVPDVLEGFYDRRLFPHVRGAVSVQGRDGFSEVIFGARVKAEF